MDIIECLLRFKNQRAIGLLFLKLNILNIIQTEILKVLKNEVLSSEFDIDNFFFACKRIFCVLEEALLQDDRFPNRLQIASLSCFKALKLRFSKTARSVTFETPTDSSHKSVTFPSPGLSKTPLKALPLPNRQRSSERPSESKSKATSSVHFGLAQPKLKSATTVFLTSAKTKSPKAASNRMIKSHQKAKTLLMLPTGKT